MNKGKHAWLWEVNVQKNNLKLLKFDKKGALWGQNLFKLSVYPKQIKIKVYNFKKGTEIGPKKKYKFDFWQFINMYQHLPSSRFDIFSSCTKFNEMAYHN